MLIEIVHYTWIYLQLFALQTAANKMDIVQSLEHVDVKLDGLEMTAQKYVSL